MDGGKWFSFYLGTIYCISLCTEITTLIYILPVCVAWSTLTMLKILESLALINKYLTRWLQWQTDKSPILAGVSQCSANEARSPGTAAYTCQNTAEIWPGSLPSLHPLHFDSYVFICNTSSPTGTLVEDVKHTSYSSDEPRNKISSDNKTNQIPFGRQL